MKPTWVILSCCLAYLLSATQSLQADVPPMSFLITASKETHFGKIVPIVNFLKKRNVSEIGFAIGKESHVSVTIRLRSDIKVLTADEIRRLKQKTATQQMYFDSRYLDQMTQALRDAGASRVEIKTVEIFPATSFSVDTFNKLRQQRQTFVVICRADWDVSSTTLDTSVLENPDVIPKVVKAKTVVLLADLTNPAPEGTGIEGLLEKYGIYPSSVLVFRPDQAAPSRLEPVVSSKAFLEHLYGN